MVNIFFKYVEKIIEIFMDDFSVYGDSFDEYLLSRVCLVPSCTGECPLDYAMLL